MTEKKIVLPIYGIVVNLEIEWFTEDAESRFPGELGRDYTIGGVITSNLKIDLSTTAYEDIWYDGAMNAIESIILAHACAGIDIESPRYVEGIVTAVNACDNQVP